MSSRQRFARPLTLVGGPGRARRRHAEGARSDARTSRRPSSLAGRVQRPGFVVPLKVEVSRPKVERLVALPR